MHEGTPLFGSFLHSQCDSLKNIFIWLSFRSFQNGLIITSSTSCTGLETVKSLLYNYTLLFLLYRLERPIAFVPHSKWTSYYNARLIIHSGSWSLFHTWGLLFLPDRLALSKVCRCCLDTQGGKCCAISGKLLWNPLSGNIFSRNCRN